MVTNPLRLTLLDWLLLAVAGFIAGFLLIIAV